MRKLHELYALLWERIKDKDYISGLCIEIRMLCTNDYISTKELIKLLDHFKSEKPTRKLNSGFFNSYMERGWSWWWGADEDTNPINRKAFIQHLLNKTKELDI